MKEIDARVAMEGRIFQKIVANTHLRDSIKL